MDWLGDNPWLAWLGVALVLAAIEAATVDFVFIMLAGGRTRRPLWRRRSVPGSRCRSSSSWSWPSPCSRGASVGETAVQHRRR